jgi:hypothetical protein
MALTGQEIDMLAPVLSQALERALRRYWPQILIG